ncbi:MAG TPA: sensor domain-containing diguanylate cyclase [Coleofasciculaceae cyanobacterium]
MLDIQSFPDFASAVHAILDYLHQRLGFDLWMVTRTEGDDWIVLQANDHGYGVKAGAVFRWTDSFCSRMVNDNGPRIAPCSSTVPAYATAPIASQVPIGAYVGVPLTHNGALFGTLCAIHPTPQPEAIATELPLVELMAKLLSTILHIELAASEQLRRAERSHVEAMHDGLTDLYNRRGWDQLLEFEEKRCEQYGHSACAISIDLDGLKQVNDTQGHAKGDELIRRAGQVLQQSVRKQDIVARVGGDEFAVLCVECNRDSGKQLLERLQSALKDTGVEASLGMAERHPGCSLYRTYEAADEAMYGCKRSRAKSISS